LTLTPNAQLYTLADLLFQDLVLQLRVRVDWRSIHVRNYVERTQITFGSRRIGFNRAHHDTFVGALKQITKVWVIAERLDPDSQPGSHDFVTGDQLGADFFGHVSGDREAQAAIHPVNQRVHADYLAVD